MLSFIESIIINFQNSELKFIKYIQSINFYQLDKIMYLICLIFNHYIYIIVIIILYYYKILNKDKILLLLIGQIIIIFIKNIIKRKRPFDVDINIKNLESTYIDKYSFPSAHTFNAFLLFLIIEYNSIIPYLIGFSRIYLGVHYPSDVFAGAILATAVYSLQKKY